MIESNGILGRLMSQSHTLGRSHLTDKQSQHITEKLSKYDPNNLTKADAKEIVSSFRKAGIRPSKALKEAMSAEGFDAKTVAKKAGLRPIKALKQAMLAEGLDAKILAKKGGLQPSPSNGIAEKKKSLNISENQLSELYKLLHQYHNDDTLYKDRNSLLNSIQTVLGGVEMIGLKQVTRAHETNQKMIQTV
jgi:hypothetical protein